MVICPLEDVELKKPTTFSLEHESSSAATNGNLNDVFLSDSTVESRRTKLRRVSNLESSKLIRRLIDNLLFVVFEVLDEDILVNDFFESSACVAKHFLEFGGLVAVVDGTEEVERIHL